MLTFSDILELAEKVEKMEIPGPVVSAGNPGRTRGSLNGHPLSAEEVAAISGLYLELARTWMPEALGTSSRAKVPDLRKIRAGVTSFQGCLPGGGRWSFHGIASDGTVDRLFYAIIVTYQARL